jgi:hypothetical protein
MAATTLFPFRPFLCISKRMWVEYVPSRECNKNSSDNFVQCFHCSDRNKICMHVWVMKYGLYNFSDSACRLNVLIFAFKSGLARHKDE